MTTPITPDLPDLPVTPTARDIQVCPRCAAQTFGRLECPSCGLALTPEFLADYAAQVQAQRQSRRLALAALTIALACGLVGFSVGYPMGKRSVAVESRAEAAAVDDQAAAVFRGMPRNVQLQLHAARLRMVYDSTVLPVTAVRFSPIAVPNQDASPGQIDLTLVTNVDSVWKRLPYDARQVMLARLSSVHRTYLALAGARDTMGYAIAIAFRAAPGQPESLLALRDRHGQTFFR